MPNRLIKETINESRGLTSCTFFAQDLYKRLITYADDYGRFNADPQIMIARLYPRELAVVSVDDLMDALVELTGAGKIAFYTSTARKEVYGAFPKWGEHQRLRDSKKKMPDPAETAVNDWYLRRFIPVDLKVKIVQRDNFKCKICGKHVAETNDALRLVKMSSGQFHIDHIVPCNQGGRATEENLRLTCPKCNLSRKKTFSFDEVLSFNESCGELPQVAASCGELPPESNPIRIQSESNPKESSARFTPPTLEEMTAYFLEKGGTEQQAAICYSFYDSKDWMVGKTKMKKWRSAVTGWIARDRERGHTPSQPKGGMTSAWDSYESF